MEVDGFLFLYCSNVAILGFSLTQECWGDIHNFGIVMNISVELSPITLLRAKNNEIYIRQIVNVL